MFEEQDLFVGGEYNTHTFRIPTLVPCGDGGVMAICEGRRNGQGDHGDIDLMMRRSFDGGRRWDEVRVIQDESPGEEITIGNPCPVYDRATGRVWLPFCRNNERPFVTYSDNGGGSWAERREITDDLKGFPFDWKRIATGPVNGIQMKSGRLVCPLWLNDKIGGQYYAALMFSDDHGDTWQAGGMSSLEKTNETTIAESSDGVLCMNMRSNGEEFRRGVAWSDDGGETLRDEAFVEEMPDPRCQGSMLRLSPPDQSGPAELLFANAAATDDRVNLTVRLSRDGGKTWPLKRTVDPGRVEYSCMVNLPDGAIGLLYEVSEEKKYKVRRLRFVRFDRDWLESGK
jgi:sialidase-1